MKILHKFLPALITIGMIAFIVILLSIPWGGPAKPLEPTSPPTKVELKFRYFEERGNTNDPLVEELYKALNGFNETNSKGTTLKVEIFPKNPNVRWSLISARASANQKPDTDWKYRLTLEEREQKRYYDLQRYLDANPDWKASFRPGLLESVSQGGAVYGIPVYASYTCLYYNTELFERTGIKAESIRTWEDLLAACETLKGSGTTPIALAGRDGVSLSRWMSYLVERLGGLKAAEALADDAEDATFEQDCFIRAGELLMGLRDKGFLQDNAAGENAEIASDRFLNGEAAIYCADTSFIPTIHGDASKVAGKVGVMHFPVIKNGDEASWQVRVNSVSLGINGKYPEQSIEFPKYLTEENTQRAILETGRAVPAIRLETEKTPEVLSQVMDLTDSGSVSRFCFFEDLFRREGGELWNQTLVGMMGGTEPRASFAYLQSAYKARNREVDLDY